MSELKEVLKKLKRNKNQLPYYFRYAEITTTASTLNQNAIFLSRSNQHATEEYVLESANKPIFIPCN